MRTTPPTSAECAQWAALCVEKYKRLTGSDHGDSLGDLLCDLMHWAKRERFDFNAALFRASGHFAAELRDEDADDPAWIERAIVIAPEAYQGLVEALEFGLEIGKDNVAWDWDEWDAFMCKAKRALIALDGGAA